jgi:hypothetical protein
MKDLIFYGVGEETRKYLSNPNKLYNPLVFCITNLENGEMKKFGCDVVTIDEAIKRYPETEIFICANQYNSAKMLQILFKNGVPQNQFILQENIE